MIRTVSCFLLVLASMAWAASAEGDGALAIVNVNVIPMDADRVLENHTVIVEDGRIRAVGAGLAPPTGARIIDGNGRFLMPGLADLHVHVRRADEYVNYLAWGVTTIMHLGGSSARGEQLLQDRRRIAAGEMLGPNIYTTRRTLDGDPPTSGNQLAIGTPDAARKEVADMKAAGFDFIKIYNNVSVEVFRAIVDEAARQELSVIGHIPRNFDPQIALRGGLKAVAHTEEFFFTYFKGPRSTKNMDLSYRPDVSKIPELAKVVAANGVATMPDLCFSFTNLLMWDELDNVWADAEMEYQHPNTVLDWQTGNINRRDEIENFIFREQIKYQLMQELTRAFQKAGVLQVIGTDASLPGLFPGKAAHRELSELVKAGLSNFDALTIGTRNGGDFVHKYIDEGARFGRIEPGYRADLMLVEGNPLDDVRNARNVAGVVVAGRWVDREELATGRSELAGRYEELLALSASIDRALRDDGAEEVVRNILATHRDDAEMVDSVRDQLNTLGYKAAFADDLDRAHMILELATRIFPESANAWDSLGEITAYMGDRDTAIACFKKALEIDPEFSNSRVQLEKFQAE